MLETAEALTQRGGERHRPSVERFPWIACRLRMNYVPISFQGAVEAITGYAEKDFKAGRPKLDEIIHPDDLPRANEILGKACSILGFSIDFESRIIRKDGQIRWLSWSIRNVCDETGDSAFAEGMMYDITERRRMEQKLSALHRHALQLSTADTIREIVSGTLDAMEFTLGFDHADFCLVKDGSIYIQESRGMPGTVSALPIEGPSVIVKAARTKNTFRIPDTSKEPAFLDNPATGPKGEVLHMLSELAVPVLVQYETVAVLNIENTRADAFTEDDEVLLETLATHTASAIGRLREEAELQESVSLLRATLESTADGILVVDRGGRVSTFNRRFAEMWRIPEPLLEAKDHGKLLRFVMNQLDDPEQFLGKVQELCSEPEREPFDVLRFKDGRVFERYSQPQRLGQEIVGRVWSFRNITERERMEGELRKLTQFQESIIDNAHIWINVLDEKANVLVWNKAAEAISGYSRGEVIGHGKIWEWLYPDEEYRRRLTEAVAALVRHREVSESVETKIKRKDGQIRIISWNERNLLGGDGKAVGSLALGRDVTEQRRLEEALRQSEDRYRFLYEESPAVNVIIDANGKVKQLNRSAAEGLGYSKDELVGRDALELIVPEQREEVASVLVRGLRGESTPEVAVDLYARDGSIRTILFSPGQVLLRDDDTASVLLTGIDITERKRMEEKLRQYSSNLEQLVVERTGKLAESEKRFRELTDLLPQIVFETDGKGRISFGNRAGFAITGYSQTDLDKGLNAIDLFAPEDHDKVQDRIARVLVGEKSSGTEYLARRKDGSTFPVIIHTTPILRGNRAVGLRGIAIDITEHKETEKHLLKVERLAAIGETARMIGHDLRNPLQGISGATAVLSQHFGQGADEMTLEMLKTIDGCVKYADKIVDDLLYYTRELHLEVTKTNPKRVIGDVIQLFRLPSNVTLLDLTESKPQMEVDADKIKRVFVNLMDNAVAAMPKGGKITVKSKVRGRSLEIQFTDTGVGIRKKEMKTLWKPFHTTKAKGIGLGLPTCKRIVEAHGGTISVRSIAGKGTTFLIRLPIESFSKAPIHD